MNSAEIGLFIKDSSKLDVSHLSALRELCDAHPYSGLFPILYLKALSNTKSIEFDEKLKEFAIKVPNRALLYTLINEDSNPVSKENVTSTVPEIIESEVHNSNIEVEKIVEIKIESEELTETPTVNQVTDLERNVNDESNFEENLSITEIYSEKQDFVNSKDEEVSVAQNPIEKEEDTQTNSSEESEDSSVYPDQNSIDCDKLDEEESWLDNTITFEGFEKVSDSIETERETETKRDQEKDEETVVLNIDLDSSKLSEFESREVIDKKSVSAEVLEIPKTKKKSFYDWLDVSPNKQVLEKLELSEPETSNVELNITESEESDSSDSQKNKVQTLVDKFIETEPRISRPKAEFFSPVKNAKESVNEDGIPISETLAKIYELQGNYPKAITVLEKLMALIPNKQATFESKIAEIKKRMEA